MAALNIKVGDTIPQGVFPYVPYSPELEDGSACGVPTALKTDEWAGKTVVIVSVPGAFTPTCHVNHIPPFLEKYDELKAKGVDVIALVAANDPFVMSGWSRVLGLKEKAVALSDPNARWSSQLGLSVDLTARDFGIRTARYAIILKDLKVVYVGVEPGPGVSVSGADAILTALTT